MSLAEKEKDTLNNVWNRDRARNRKKTSLVDTGELCLFSVFV